MEELMKKNPWNVIIIIFFQKIIYYTIVQSYNSNKTTTIEPTNESTL